jgi:ankyrin repeat protein
MASADDKLCRAAMHGDVAEMERQIAAGADPNAFEGTLSWTPLQRAAENGHVAAIAALLKAGARVDGTDSFGYTPLMWAIFHDHGAAVDALLAAGADVHCATRHDGYTALHRASTNGRLGAARMLLEAGARTDARDERGKRPVDDVRVLLARSSGQRHCVVLLLHCRHVQVCRHSSTTHGAALRVLLASAAPWSRRRPVAIACYAVGWEWEA